MLGISKDDLVEEHNHPPLPEDVSHVELLSFVEHKTWSHEIVWHVLHDYHPEWLSQIPTGGEETPLHALVRTGNVRLLKMLLADVRDEAESVGEETGDNGEALEAKTVATSQTNLLKTSMGTKHPRKACLAIDLNALDRAGRRVKDLPREPNFSKEYPEMQRLITELVAFEEHAHDVAMKLKKRVARRKRREAGQEGGGKGKEGGHVWSARRADADTEAEDEEEEEEEEDEDEEDEEDEEVLATRLLASLSRNLNWISTPHHKPWTVLHILVSSGYVSLVRRLLHVPCACAGGKIRLATRTRDCGRSVWEVAAEAGTEEGMAMREVLKEVGGQGWGDGGWNGDGGRAMGVRGVGSTSAPFPYPRCPRLLPPSASGPFASITARSNLNACVKLITFVRHAQGTHNAAVEREGEEAYRSWEWEDAELTAKGEEQARRLGEEVKGGGKGEGEGGKIPIELVVVSPLRRTLMTAVLAFGEQEEEEEEEGREGEEEGGNEHDRSPGATCEEGDDSPANGLNGPCHGPRNGPYNGSCNGPCKGLDTDARPEEGAGTQKRRRKRRRPRFVAMEAVRETAGVDPCNKRSDRSLLASRFPGVDFSEVRQFLRGGLSFPASLPPSLPPLCPSRSNAGKAVSRLLPSLPFLQPLPPPPWTDPKRPRRPV
jgi:hypothetical protein